jgi:hypothetical protein
MAQSASFPIMSGRTLTCKPRYKRRVGELSAYWIFCLRLNDIDCSQGESDEKPRRAGPVSRPVEPDDKKETKNAGKPCSDHAAIMKTCMSKRTKVAGLPRPARSCISYLEVLGRNRVLSRHTFALIRIIIRNINASLESR